jgi:uncharacterized membrane protein (UPF0127 family)
MRYPIDVVFLLAGGQIVRCVQALKPWRMAAASGAHHTLELAPGSIARFGLEPGQQLHWQHDQQQEVAA